MCRASVDVSRASSVVMLTVLSGLSNGRVRSKEKVVHLEKEGGLKQWFSARVMYSLRDVWQC